MNPVCVLLFIASILWTRFYLTSMLPKILAYAILPISTCWGLVIYPARFCNSLAAQWAADDALVTDGRAGKDFVLAARMNVSGVIVGALVLRLTPPSIADSISRHTNKKTAKPGDMDGGTGVIRAWITQETLRGRGIGMSLLRAAVQLTRERCGHRADIIFQHMHGNIGLELYSILDWNFWVAERRAVWALKDAIAEWNAGKKKDALA